MTRAASRVSLIVVLLVPGDPSLGPGPFVYDSRRPAVGLASGYKDGIKVSGKGRVGILRGEAGGGESFFRPGGWGCDYMPRSGRGGPCLALASLGLALGAWAGLRP